MRKSFSVFTNPEYNPKKEVLDNAVNWINKNVVKKNKDLKEQAADLPGNASAAEKQKLFLNKLLKILQTGKQDGVDPLRLLKELQNMIYVLIKY